VLKLRWVILFPIILTAVILIILFAPIVLDPSFANGATAMTCGPKPRGSQNIVCTSFVQYDSIAYLYGGWGAYFQTGGYYTIESWLCGGPCVAPFAGIIWGSVTMLLGADLVSVVFVIRRKDPWPINLTLGSGVGALLGGLFVLGQRAVEISNNCYYCSDGGNLVISGSVLFLAGVGLLLFALLSNRQRPARPDSPR
jgi:hypothetical protein